MKHSRLADIAAPLGLLWRRQSLSRRIMLTLLVAMLPFVLVILLTSANSRWAISDSFDSLLMDDTRKRSQIVSMELDAFNDMLFQLVSEDAVVDQLTVINQAQDAVMGNYYGNALYNMIKRYKYARTGLAQTAVIAATGTYVSYDILHEFVEKIVVHAASDPKGKNRTQEIDIYYKGIGALEVSKVTSSRQE